jgi:hypothetical protein
MAVGIASRDKYEERGFVARRTDAHLGSVEHGFRCRWD